MLRDVPSPRLPRKAAASKVRTRMREFCSESVGPRPFLPCASVVCRCISRELPTLFAVQRRRNKSASIRRHQTPSDAINRNQPQSAYALSSLTLCQTRCRSRSSLPRSRWKRRCCSASRCYRSWYASSRRCAARSPSAAGWARMPPHSTVAGSRSATMEATRSSKADPAASRQGSGCPHRRSSAAGTIGSRCRQYSRQCRRSSECSRGASARYRRRDGLSRDAAPTGARHATRCTFCMSARIAAECVRCNSERGGKIQRSRSSVTMWIRSGHSPSSAPIRACKKSSALSTCLSSPCPRTSPPAAAPAVHFRGAALQRAGRRALFLTMHKKAR